MHFNAEELNASAVLTVRITENSLYLNLTTHLIRRERGGRLAGSRLFCQNFHGENI